MKILIEPIHDGGESRIARSIDHAAELIKSDRSLVLSRLADSNGKVIIGRYSLTII